MWNWTADFMPVSLGRAAVEAIADACPIGESRAIDDYHSVRVSRMERGGNVVARVMEHSPNHPDRIEAIAVLVYA